LVSQGTALARQQKAYFPPGVFDGLLQDFHFYRFAAEFFLELAHPGLELPNLGLHDDALVGIGTGQPALDLHSVPATKQARRHSVATRDRWDAIVDLLEFPDKSLLLRRCETPAAASLFRWEHLDLSYFSIRHGSVL
jgi:hypothetical protein